MTAPVKERRCRWTDLPLPDDQPRVRVHPAFRHATMHWSHTQRQQYAELVRQLGTLDHPQLTALREQTWRDIHDARAAHLDRVQRRTLDLALARDGTD